MHDASEWRAKMVLWPRDPARVICIKVRRCVTLMEADVPDYTQKPLSLSRRWEAYRPTKGVWLWTGAGCIVATIVVGFAWGGWVTGGTARSMASDAADGARAQLAAMVCVAGFNHGPDAVAQLADAEEGERLSARRHAREERLADDAR